MKISGYIENLPKKAIKKLSDYGKIIVSGTLIVGSLSANADFNNDFDFNDRTYKDTSEFMADFTTNKKSTLKGDTESFDLSKSSLLEVLNERKIHLQNIEIEKTFQFLKEHASNEFGGNIDIEMSIDAKQHLIGTFLNEKGNLNTDFEFFTTLNDTYKEADKDYKDVVTREATHLNQNYNMNYHQAMAKPVTVDQFYANHGVIKKMEQQFSNKIKILSASNDINDRTKAALHSHFEDYSYNQIHNMIELTEASKSIKLTVGDDATKEVHKMRNSFKI